MSEVGGSFYVLKAFLGDLFMFFKNFLFCLRVGIITNFFFLTAVFICRIPPNLKSFKSVPFASHSYPFVMSSIAFHPAVNRTIILAGFSTGQISLWNIDADDYLFAPHTDNVTHIMSNPARPYHIVSSSHDGTLWQMDLEKKRFLKIFKDETPCAYFDFISPSEFLVAQVNGKVTMVDSRENKSVRQWRWSDQTVRTISVHPTQKDLYLSLNGEGSLKVWDLRFYRKEALYEIRTDPDMRSAFFSPVTGNSILCSSKVAVRTYSSYLEDHPRGLKSLWKFDLTDSKFYTTANWIPSCDNAFIMCDNLLKKVMILNKRGEELSHLKISRDLALQAVHPVHNMLAISYNLSQETVINILSPQEICINNSMFL